jgi:hypothetical protein
VYERYRAYDAAGDGARWKYRGSGYLYFTHGLVLEATYESRTKVIVIRNIAAATATNVDCHLFTLWVRMAGPELFAGKANATNNDVKESSTSCHWEFPVPHLQINGQYQIDVKLLVYNGFAPIRLQSPPSGSGLSPSQCYVQAGNDTTSALQQQHQHEGIRGFKLYFPVASCCEICTRLPHCHYWATPPVDFDASFTNNGCEFWFDDPTYVIPPSKHLGRNSTTATTVLQRRQRQRARRHQHRRQNRRQLGDVPTAHGPPHNGTFAYFMGCGWSLWFSLDYPCLSGDLDDRVYVVEPTMRYSNGSDHHAVDDNDKDDKTKVNDTSPNVLPLCTKADERGSSGRWVRGTATTVADCPPYRHYATVSSSFDIVEFTPDQPQCWHRDNFATIGKTCLEMNCQFIPKPSLWRSSVHEETDWFGVWRPYRCDYLEFTKDQLQSCITEHRISIMDVYGHSIAAMLKEYLHQRLEGIVMYPPTTAEPTGTTIVLTTLGALHWAGGSDDDLARTAQEEMQTLRHKYGKEAMVYLVPGFFLSSERAMQIHVDRMQLVNSLVLEPLSSNETTTTVILLEAFDLSAAFTYDTAAQNDGMHIIGPTMKMIITKLFHHMCADTTTGSRVGGSY